MSSDAFVKTIDLTRVYLLGTISVGAIRGVNLSVQKGRFLAVTGASGSGKSTLVNLLGGLDRPSSGTVSVDGKIISQLDKKTLALYRRRSVGMIFQAFNLIPYYTALENVALPLLFADVAKRKRYKQAADMLEAVGLGHRTTHRPSELSGGEQQRVAIARALINRPELLLADEPTGNLDSKTGAQIIRMLAELNTSQGLTIIMISHEEYLLKEFATDLIRLHDGQIVEYSTIRAMEVK